MPLEEVEKTATNQLLMLSKIPQPAYGITKELMRGNTLRKLDSTREEDIQVFVDLIQKPMVQKTIAMYLQQLKKKKSK